MLKLNHFLQKIIFRKYITLFILLFFVKPFSTKAAVSGYSFSTSNGTYSAITGTTLFSGLWDDSNSSLLTLPFTFTYNGINYTTVGVNSNGFITMGAVTSTVYCGLQTSAANSIAAYGTDLVGNTGSTVQYTTSGTAPNRKFIVQWTDCKHYAATGDHFSFQLVLNETSNTVVVILGTFTCITTMGANTCTDVSTESGNVGLKGASTQDINIRSITNGTNTWTTSVNGASISAVCNLSSTNFPASGLIYSWTPPVPAPMVFSSATTAMLNNGQICGQNSQSNTIIQLQVVTAGSLSPFNISSLTLSTAGSTNALIDISRAKVYYTGTNGTFSTAVQFGSTITSPNGIYVINGSATLQEGTNFFWITYDITANAIINDLLAGCCSQFVGTGTIVTQIPAITCPVGSRIVSHSIGYWTALTTTAPSASGGVMLVLSDGTVMAKSSSGGASYGNLWNKLTPSANGSYANGTWTTLAPMINTRLYFSSQVLTDGRVYIAGGEYGTGLQQAETYNPLTNVWTAAPSPAVNISDANSEILPDGRVLQALVAGTLKGTTIYNPLTNTYGAGPSCLGIHNESAWLKLPDNSILMVDRLSTNSERYIPSLNTWVADATVPVALYDPFGDESGGALLLPDGRAFFIGSLGHNAYYTPSGNSSPGVWAAGPDIPGARGVPDGAAAVMVNGNLLLAASPVPTSANHFPPPTSFFEFDYTSNTFTQIQAPGGSATTNISCYLTNMVALPDGNILYSTQGSTQYYIYTPGSEAIVSGKPVIAAINQSDCNTYKITGTKFNGISQGATYGDDWQMATNYPIIRLSNGSNVYYCRTFNWNSTGVQRGTLADTVQFTLPAGLPIASYTLVVTANGFSSDPVNFTPIPYLTSLLTPSAVCSGSAFNYAPVIAPINATYTWTRAAVVGISNPAILTPQSSVINETLLNTTSSPKNVIYDITITSNGCLRTQQVTVIINPTPTPLLNASTTFCSSTSAVILNAGVFTSYIWSTGATTQTISVSSTGSFTVTVSNAPGCTAVASASTNDTCVIKLNLKMYFEGFYQSNGFMRAVTDPSGHPFICDTVIVELHNINPPYTFVTSASGVINRNGSGQFEFSGSVLSNSFFIVIRHRNSIQTWSKTSVLFNSPLLNFDFTSF